MATRSSTINSSKKLGLFARMRRSKSDFNADCIAAYAVSICSSGVACTSGLAGTDGELAFADSTGCPSEL
jgi:hypothetical protein